jgi:hypothetical protein
MSQNDEEGERKDEVKRAVARPEPPKKARAYASSQFIRDEIWSGAWLFPVLMGTCVVFSVWFVWWALRLQAAEPAADLSGRLTWAVSSMMFFVLFAFFYVLCATCMFKCGKDPAPAYALVGSTFAGAITVWELAGSDVYLGPRWLKAKLEESPFAVGNVRLVSSILDGVAIWAAILLLTTSAVILANEIAEDVIEKDKALSRQLRASRMLMQAATALLITGVASTTALHRWPLESLPAMASADSRTALPAGNSGNDADEQRQKRDTATEDQETRRQIEQATIAIGAAVGTVFSMLLGAAYLPLGIVLRQRAYRVITPWQRADTWLTVHGFSIAPSQQFARILLILSPLLASGPIGYLIKLLNSP